MRSVPSIASMLQMTDPQRYGGKSEGFWRGSIIGEYGVRYNMRCFESQLGRIDELETQGQKVRIYQMFALIV